MWVRKFERDEKMGVDSPIPTQGLSTEEFVPRPINENQRKVELRMMEMGEANAKRIGMDRRKFMRTSMGMATAFMAYNSVYGPYVEVHAEEQFDPAVTDELFPKGDYFVLDVQAHFTDGFAIPGFRNAEFMKNMGFDTGEMDDSKDAFSFPNFVKEMFLDSETSVLVISGVPGREKNTDKDGKILVDKERGGGVLPSWLMSRSKKQINELAGSVRALCQGNCAPNHYWDRAAGAPNYNELFEQMEREVKIYGIDSWKWYCHTDPGLSGGGFQLDDDMSARFYEKSRELGIRTVSVHKGFSYQSRKLGHLANPKDMEKAALNNPDFNFVVYHSALKHGSNEENWITANEYNPETGDFLWHSILMDIKKRNPQIQNLYPEIGSSFALTFVSHPEMCQHLIGKNIKYYGSDHVIWGTDCIWWGSPQAAIEYFKRFQITDENCEKYGYTKLTKEDKAKIFGLNAAKLYNVDPAAKLGAIKADGVAKLKTAYLQEGAWPSNRGYGWVRDNA